ncbi:hypothetical protein I350_04159 [Cryptococcus amylolentus CBS 6273]|uniref:Uncharacterized protein n=1 Tax=Cryptococcus amylolentus CBS 6273 TaxID=1296118 RepID=A0A1E3K151_9TREE|nr:hypothetical protein I350_04159 [Cryptococcus amylolentus CBS 6273]
MIQTLRVYTNRQGNQWANDLQRVASAMNNSVRPTSKTSAAQLVYGKRLSLLPPIQTAEEEAKWREFGLVQPSQEEWQMAAQRMDLEEKMARDALLMVDNSQAIQANRHRRPEVAYKAGNLPFRTSTRYHGDVSLTLLSSDQPPPPQVLQVIEERVLKPNERHPGVPQVRVQIEGERVSGRWMGRDEAEKYEGWDAAWEDYLGDDELYLDTVDVVEL